MMIKTNNKQWVLVADGGMAKVLTHRDKSFQIIHEIQSEFQHTASKSMSTDKDGNFYSRKHHSKGSNKELHDKAETDFIFELSNLLTKELHAGSFDELNLIMAPKALGKIRHCLCKNVRALINKEIPKDLSNIPNNKLFIKLGELL